MNRIWYVSSPSKSHISDCKRPVQAIVVGSALHFDPNMFVTMADFGMLSPDGRSRSFDANGKGYARGEGICVVILKRLHDAEESNDRIHAVVRATGANHDGTKNGITLSNPVAQEALMRDVYRRAGTSTKDTVYFEAHGTVGHSICLSREKRKLIISGNQSRRPTGNSSGWSCFCRRWPLRAPLHRIREECYRPS